MFHRNRAHRIAGRIFFGLVVLAIGLTLTLDNLHVIRAHEVFRYWPVALIGLGLLKMLECRGGFGTFFWGIVTVLGGLLLANRLGYVPWNIWGLWPILLVLLGFSIIFGAFRPRGGRGRCRVRFGDRFGDFSSETSTPGGKPGDSGAGVKGSLNVKFGGDPGESPGRGPGGAPGEDPPPRRESSFDFGARARSAQNAAKDPAGADESRIDISTLFGASERAILSQDFRGGRISAIMGAVALDLRPASIQTSPAELDITAFWAGIQLRVPEDWTVVLQCSPIVGAAEDSTRKPLGGPEKRLIVRGDVVMSGVEIRN